MGRQKHVHMIITGRVQGVWFRASTKDVADRLGIKGWVRNLPNGAVEVDAIGDVKSMEQFIEWCYQGPPGAHVVNVEIKELEPVADFDSFKIVR